MKNILAIDIGSSKTTAIIANYDEISDTLSISGVGIAPSYGIKKGAITNIDFCAKSIKQALSDAKRIAGIEIKEAIVSISSTYTKSITSHGIVNIPGNEITQKEINRAIQTALYNANIPQDYQILQAIPYDFKVDDLNEIEDPAGMSGSRLEVALHIITAQRSGIENIKKTLKLANLEIKNIVAAAYASGLATLKEDEKELGVAVIDIGAATSDLGIFINKSFRYSDHLAVGSHHVTNDLSMALHTTLADAEGIKINFEDYIKSEKDLIEISVIGNEEEKQQASITTITQVMSARIEETFLLLNKEIVDSGLKNKIGAGIVLTGGFTNFYNIKEIASQFFESLPVRIGIPKKIDGLFENIKSSEFATSIGLLLYGKKEGLTYEIDSNRKLRTKYTLEQTSESENKIKNNIDKETEKKEITTILAEKDEPNIFQKFKTWLSKLF